MTTDAERNIPGKNLVVFGCGYVGTAVAREAQARGWRVTALTRNAARAVLLREVGVETVVADLASDAWHAHVPPGPAFVLNCVSSGGDGLAGYVLGQSSKHWIVKNASKSVAAGSTIKITAQGDNGPIEATARVVAAK